MIVSTEVTRGLDFRELLSLLLSLIATAIKSAFKLFFFEAGDRALEFLVLCFVLARVLLLDGVRSERSLLLSSLSGSDAESSTHGSSSIVSINFIADAETVVSAETVDSAKAACTVSGEEGWDDEGEAPVGEEVDEVWDTAVSKGKLIDIEFRASTDVGERL
jgi:hypothetical protein